MTKVTEAARKRKIITMATIIIIMDTDMVMVMVIIMKKMVVPPRIHRSRSQNQSRKTFLEHRRLCRR